MKRLLILAIGIMLVACGAATAAIGEQASPTDVSYTIDSSTTPYSGRPDTGGDELADGTIATNDVNHSNWVQWKPSLANPDDPAYALIKFDVGWMRHLYKVEISYYNHPSWNQYTPEKLQMRYSTDNTNWTGWHDRFGFTGTGNNVYTDTFSILGEYRYVEMRIWCDGYDAGKDLMLTEVTFYNSSTTGQLLSTGKFYSFYKAESSSYADEYPVSSYSEGVLLTDEEVGNSSWTSKWVAWWDPDWMNVIIDLGDTYPVNTMKLTACSETNSAIRFPDFTEIQYSTNGTSWTSYGTRNYSPADTATYSVWTSSEVGSFVQARYIKFVFYNNANWVFLTELEVYGKVTNKARYIPDVGCYNGSFSIEPDYGYNDVMRHQNLTYSTTAMMLWYQEMNPYYGGADFDGLELLWDNPGAHLADEKYGGASYGDFRWLTLGWLPSGSNVVADIARGNLYPTTGTKFDQHFVNWFTDSIDTTLRGDTTEIDPIWIRPMNEFNGSWSWSTYGGDPTNFKKAWRRMYNIAQKVGAADDHIFLWSPAGKGSTSSSHDPEDYYPGDQYVDWVGISCYSNYGYYPVQQLTGQSGSGGVDLVGDYGYKPLMISEGACEYNWSNSTNRVNWIDDWFDTGGTAMEVPELKAAVWFNDSKHHTQYDFDSLGTSEKNEFRSEVDRTYWRTMPE